MKPLPNILYINNADVKKIISNNNLSFNIGRAGTHSLSYDQKLDKIIVEPSCLYPISLEDFLSAYLSTNINDYNTDLQWLFWSEDNKSFLAPHYNCKKLFTASWENKKTESPKGEDDSCGCLVSEDDGCGCLVLMAILFVFMVSAHLVYSCWN